MKRLYVAMGVVLFLLLLPLVLWFIKPTHDMKVAIIDKTVDVSKVEHQGIDWVLDYEKIDRLQSTKDIDASTTLLEGTALQKSYEKADFLYLVDTDGPMQATKSSKSGLTEEEWQAFVKHFEQENKSTFIAEHHSFGSTTTQQVSDDITAYLGVTWSGWIGRSFEELNPQKNAEIPEWITNKSEEEWSYEGPGIILYHEKDEAYLVLTEKELLHDASIQVKMSDEGQAQLGFSATTDYEGWFDLVSANYGTETVATFDFHLTEAGEKMLVEQDIPLNLAAITQRTRDHHTSYYFAGNFSEATNVPSVYQMSGIAQLYQLGKWFGSDALYWRLYVPLMQAIFSQHETKESPPLTAQEKQEAYASPDGSYNARINGEQFEVWQEGAWQPLTIKGVNIGMGKPGYFPGEAAITEEEYYRWFEQITEMNSNTIRVYTLQPPGFYRALEHFNAGREKPLYVMHGIWIEEEALEETLDAYAEPTLTAFKEEIERLVDVVHGNRYVPYVPGHAHGMYDTDVSQYISAWIIGIEWYPNMVENTNLVHAGIGEYQGNYFETKEAQPFEHWLAEQMDALVTYQYDTYHWLTPMSFTNWVTTDLLTHADEPNTEEDLVSVNPNVIYTKEAMNDLGQFASYHVYPYYPDFLNYDEAYLNYVDHRGEKNSYAGYLHELHDAHRMPILIAEFGLPASRGKTHENAYGFDQGFNSEQKQGEVIRHLFEDIMAEDLMGGLIFSWQDEWFKRTWNTVDYDDPDRRPYWSNVQTNEQRFGILSFDRNLVQIDGKTDEWQEEEPLLTTEDLTLHVKSDETYLYLTIKSKQLEKENVRILLDTVANQGNTSDRETGDQFPAPVEYLVKLNQQGESRIVQDVYYDYFNYLYAKKLSMLPDRMPNPQKDSGQFSTIDFVLNKALTLPDSQKKIPFSSYETGLLREGTSDPTAVDFDSLTDYHLQGDTLEIRLPWLLIGATDPSQKKFLGDFISANEKVDEVIKGIGIGVYFEGQAPPKSLVTYEWQPWDIPQSTERLKASYPIIQQLFAEYE